MSYKFTPGLNGHPLKNDDILIVQDRVLEFMKGLFASYGDSISSSFILSGCEIVASGGNLDVSPGYIVYDGEVISVPAHSVPDGASAYWWELITASDQPRVYQDGQTRNTREQRYMNLVSGVSAPVPSMPQGAPRFEDLVVDAPTTRLDSIDAAWINYIPASFTVSSGGVFTPDADPAQVQFRYKIIGKTLMFNFSCSGDLNQNAGTIDFNLPTGLLFNSSFDLTSACYIGSSQGFNIERMEVNVNDSQYIRIVGNIGAGGMSFSGQFIAELA